MKEGKFEQFVNTLRTVYIDGYLKQLIVNKTSKLSKQVIKLLIDLMGDSISHNIVAILKRKPAVTDAAFESSCVSRVNNL